MFRVPERYRVATGRLGSTKRYGNNGLFIVNSTKFKRPLNCIASDGEGWEHVSVSLPDRCPTWDEMNFIKGKFWDPEDTVIQYHPPKSEYVNHHPNCLHLWRPIGVDLPRPPKYMVG